MISDAARANIGAIATAGVALVIYTLSAPGAPAWPTTETLGAAGHLLVEAISRVPVGDQATRAITVAVLMGSVAAGLIAWSIARRGSAAPIAIGCALTMALSPSAWHQATSNAPGSIAAALIACAIAVTMVPMPSRARIVAAAIAATFALVLQPPLPGSEATWATALPAIRREWLLPSLIIMGIGVAAPVWRASPAPRIVTIGTALVVLLGGLGYDVAPFTVLPATLLAHGLQSLPLLSRRAKATVGIGLALFAGVDRWREADSNEWRLLAWRDAVERTVPAGSIILTGSRSAAALNGPLFEDRPAGVRIAFEPAVPADTAGKFYLLDDLRVVIGGAGARLTSVPLAYANTTDALERLPRGTIVGLAISAAAATAEPARVAEALALIGRAPGADLGRPVVVVGIIGAPSGEAPRIPQADRVHVLFGDLISGTDRRSPADFELRGSVAEVSVRLEGRVLAEGSGWAMIAIHPGGPLIDAVASEYGVSTWPVRVPGLEIWRVVARGS